MKNSLICKTCGCPPHPNNFQHPHDFTTLGDEHNWRQLALDAIASAESLAGAVQLVGGKDFDTITQLRRRAEELESK